MTHVPELVAEMRLPRVGSKKNRHKVRGFGRRCPSCKRHVQVSIGPSDEAIREESAIGLVARISRRRTVIPAGRAVLVEMTHFLQSDDLGVRVYDLGDLARAGGKARGRTGTKQDLSGMFETVLDGLNGNVFEDDRQVSRGVLLRDEGSCPY